MRHSIEKSERLFEEARKYIPGGVNSPVRAFGAVGGTPRFIQRAQGSKLQDVDGREYIDYVASWGPMILGHAHPDVIAAIEEAARKGTSFGAPTELEVQLAARVVEMVPSIEKVRFVNSGTEATMSAIRLARAYTGRNKIIKFAGCYHGHSDVLLTQSGSGLATYGIPGTPGVPGAVVQDTLTVPYNRAEAVASLLQQYPDQIAAIIVEPIAGNMGVVLPQEDFLPTLRQLADRYGVLLIFDEVITGFRVHAGGAQALYDVIPDLTCLGKIIGGGLPVGAYGGRKDIMQLVAPEGPVYQAGTLSGNPLAMAAGLATLSHLSNPDVYDHLALLSGALAQGLQEAADQVGLAVHINQTTSMLSLFFTDREVVDYETAQQCDTRRYQIFFHSMLESGVYLAPSQFEAVFISLAHTREDIERTVRAAEAAFAAVKHADA